MIKNAGGIIETTSTTSDLRVEADSMGEMRGPVDAYYGASTARAVEIFPISNLKFDRRFIAALGLVKRACARVNQLRRPRPKVENPGDAGVAATTIM